MVGIDLFAGAGGMSLGATQAGIHVALAVESDRHAAKTYRANHPTTAIFDDDVLLLTAADLEPWKGFSRNLVVFAGAPCQGFSWSNTRTRTLDNPTNWLFQEFRRVVRILEPSWVIFENVQGILNTANGAIIEKIRESLAEDYHLHSENSECDASWSSAEQVTLFSRWHETRPPVPVSERNIGCPPDRTSCNR